MRAVLALLALLLFLGSSHAAEWHNRRLLEQASYNNLLSAAQSEVRVIQQLYNGVFREQGWANTADFKPLLKVALNPQANLTAFFPSDDSWQRVADYYCLTQQGVLDNISNLREMLANYIKAHLVPNRTLHSSAFEDGMLLQTLAKPTTDPNGPFLTHKLSKHIINGSVVWKFKNASIYRIPGSYNYEDITVNPHRMDIKAGNAIIHVIDTLFRNTETERFWEGLRSQVQERAGLPGQPNSTGGPIICPANVTTSSRQDSFAPSQIAGLVVGVVIGLLLLAGVLMLIFVVKSHHTDFLGNLGPLKSLTSLRRGRSPGGGGSSGSPHGDLGDSDSPPAGSGSGDVFTSPLLHASGHHGGPSSSRLTQQTSLGGSSSGALTNGSWAARVSGSSGTGSSHAAAGDNPGEQMSVVNEESPFAASRHHHHQQQLQQQQYVAAAAAAAGAAHMTNGGSSVARHSSSTATGGETVSSSNTTGHHRVTDSFGSGTPFVSRGSVHGSKKDLLALAAAGAAAIAANGAMDQAADEQLYDSLGAGGLAATESVPVGRINHEHVIPFSELTLKELIGSGAEGKVYRGTWKHTDIAAKEYLPIEPAQESTAAQRGQSPSDAAMAHARAALAKEVHWLTSLNHPNLVRFCAVCLERPLVVMEFYKHGSVFAMLQKAARELARSRQARRRGYVAHFNWDRRLEMLHDVAAGMSYLHGKDHVHGDLRSPNLFVGADGKVKIGDFGFTKRLACNTASLKVKRITHPRWVAPELMMDNMMSRASDVYSFGIIMYELLTFRIPFDMFGKEQVVINVVQGFRPEVPQEPELPPGTSSSTCLFTYERLMKECWAHDPAERPSFEVIARRLKAMQRWRKLISKHGTLFRAASAIRQSSSCSSLYNTAHHGKSGAGAGAAAGAAAAAATPAGASGHTTNGMSELQPARSSVQSPGTDSMVAHTVLHRGTHSPPTSHSARDEADYVPSYSSDYDEDELPGFDDLEDFDTALPQTASAPVSEAVVAGTRLAVIGVCSHQDERDALASVAGTELSLARKVVLVGSDLPAGAFSRQSLRAATSSSLEDCSRGRRIGSSGPSFTGVSGAGAASWQQQGDQHSGGLADKRRQHRGPAATVAAAAAALATAAAAAAAGMAHRLPPNGRHHHHAAALRASTAGGDGNAAAGGAAAGSAAAAGSDTQPRRHSDPTPPKGRMSVEDASVHNGSPVHDLATAMSSGQSPLALVHVGPPGMVVDGDDEQHQHQQQQHQVQVQLRETMKLLESYPLLSSPESDLSPLTSSPLMTPEQALLWAQQGGSKHSLITLQQLQLLQQQQQQQQRVASSDVTGQQQQVVGQTQPQWGGGNQQDARFDQQQQQQQQQPALVLQQQQQQQQSPQVLHQQGRSSPSGISRQCSRTHSSEAATTATAAGEQEWLGEVYTPFDSPFYQDLSWAPSASISGLDSNPGSYSVANSVGATSAAAVAAAAAAAAAAVASETSSIGSPFMHARALKAAQSGSVTAGAGGVAAAQQQQLQLQQDDSLGTADAAVRGLSTEPVLKQALTIEYQANMTPMAAAAAEAVSVHGASRRGSGAVSVPVPRLSSATNTTNAGGVAATASAPVWTGGQGGAAHALQPDRSSVASTAASPSEQASVAGSAGAQLDVAASADVRAAATGVGGVGVGGAVAASLIVDGLSGKPASGGKGPPASPAAGTDQQPGFINNWKSHLDVPPPPAAGAAGGGGVAQADAAGSHHHHHHRPPWMRLLGLRRNLPSGPS